MKKNKIAIIGLGYVGLPLAVEFSKKYSVVGYDINYSRVLEIRSNKDVTLELTEKELKNVNVESLNDLNTDIGLWTTNQDEDISSCNIYIVTVPTPIDINKKPDLKPLKMATELVAKSLDKGDYVIYESTVYPGATEEECLPILEKLSKLSLNTDFFLGYSPERINPGDKQHTLTKIKKITSGSNKSSSIFIDNLYNSIITAGTHLASSIKVAEAAKVIENTQRDINIAFVNELAKIFNLLDIDTNDVLEAAGTKWNFLPFKPGLVGGHCIGVDPYYLAQKAEKHGYYPEIILSGRRINNSMGPYIADEVIKAMIDSNINIKKSKILIMGITFKENCPDIRNTGVISVIKRLQEFNIDLFVYDPWAKIDDVKREYNLVSSRTLPNEKFDAIILAVSHSEFININLDKFKNTNDSVIYDVKGFLNNSSHRL